MSMIESGDENIDRLTYSAGDVNRIGRELEELASSLYHVGNERLARSLAGMAECLREAASNIRGGVNGMVFQRCKDSEAATFNMISAVLATNGVRMDPDAPVKVEA